MTKLLEKAISKVRALPEKRQDELAQFILEIAEQPHQSLLTDEQAAEVELSMEEARQGKFVSDEDIAKLWKKFGL